MRFTLKGLLRFKPFDESREVPPGQIYARNRLLATGIFVNFIAAVIAGSLALTESEYAIPAYGAAAALSAIAAGLEWGAGIRARALNNLFIAALILVAIALLQQSKL